MLTRIKGVFQSLFITIANAKMTSKLTMVFVIFIIIPIMITAFVSYHNYSSLFQSTTMNYVKDSSKTTLEAIEQYVHDVDRISTMPYYMESFTSMLLTPDKTVDKQREINFYISSMNQIKRETVSVYIYDNFGNLFYTTKGDKLRSDILQKLPLWRGIAEENNGIATIDSARSKVFSGFSIVRQLKDHYTLKPLATIVFDCSLQSIVTAIERLEVNVNGSVTLLMDENMQVIYTSATQTDLPKYTDQVQQLDMEQEKFNAVINKEDHIGWISTSEATGWRMIHFVPKKSLMEKFMMTRNVTMLVTLLIISTAFVLAVACSFAITRPLKGLTKLMKQIQRGSLDVRFKVRFKDEVSAVGMHFNRMLDHMNKLIVDVRETEVRKKHAELQALQNQINPHFIYNTLETIRMTAELNDDEEAAEMTFLLGKLLRYTITRGNEVVTIMDEIEHLIRYVQLLQYRFPNKIDMTIKTDSKWNNYPIIKLVFQPIVENAILHGLDHNDQCNSISICSEVKDDYLLFIVEDNGMGMNQQIVDALRHSLTVPSTADSPFGIGLRNVHERIQLHYGQLYGVELESQEGIGTKVILRLPLVLEGLR